MEESFIRDRITELRLKKGLSEYQLSLALGNSQGYIQSISSGRTLPSMRSFLDICEFFDITPVEFFDYDNHYPEIYRDLFEKIKKLSNEDIILLKAVLDRIVR